MHDSGNTVAPLIPLIVHLGLPKQALEVEPKNTKCKQGKWVSVSILYHNIENNLKRFTCLGLSWSNYVLINRETFSIFGNIQTKDLYLT